MEIKEYIELLAAKPGPSGFEDSAADAAAALLAPLVDEVKKDVMGSVVGWRRSGVDGAPTVMLDAHLDEVGLIVTGYEGGALRFQSLGGIDARILPALEVLVHTKEEPLRGVIDVLPPHILTAEEREKPLDAEKLFIDVGLKTEEEAKSRVPLGTSVTTATPCFAMGEHRLCAKSLDDRSCVAILLAVMEKLKDKPLAVDLAVHFAVQEEVGGRGAVTGAYGIAPDFALALDVTFGDSPDTPKHKSLPLGSGAAIGVGPAAARCVSDRLEALAIREGIPYRIEVLPRGSGTDADDIQISREGVATGVVSLPLRYMHTPAEVIDLRDAQAVADLVAAWIESFGEEV